MLKRMAQWMPKLLKIMPSIPIQNDLSSLEEEYERASHGLADIHQHYDINLNEFTKGKIKNLRNGRVYASNSGLSSLELLQIAQEAKMENYFDDHVNWLMAALKKAKQENKKAEFIKRIRYACTVKPR